MFKRSKPLSEKSPLEKFIDRENALNELFGRKLIEYPLTESDVSRLYNSIQSQLSPENLHCDGEISAHEANVKWNFLQDVLVELEMCDDWGITYEGGV